MVNSAYVCLSTEVKSAIDSFKRGIGVNRMSIISNTGIGEVSLVVSLYHYIQTQKHDIPSKEFEHVMRVLQKYQKNLTEVLSTDDINTLVGAYPAVVEYALDFLGKDNISPETAVWSQNRQLTDFIVGLLKSYLGSDKNWNIYNPFMGLGTYAASLPLCHVEGEEINEECWALSQINLHAHGCDANSEIDDSFQNLEKRDCLYDAVLMTPPFGVRGGHRENDILDLAYQKVKDNGFVFCVLPMSFCSSLMYAPIRRKLINNGALLQIISLPEALFSPLTNIATCLVILKKSSKKHFLVTDGSAFVSLDKKGAYLSPMFSLQELLEKILQKDGQFVKSIEYENLNNAFDVTPAKLMLEVGENKYPTRSLGDLICIISSKQVRNSKGFCIGQNTLSNNFSDCYIRKEALSNHTKVNVFHIQDECIVLSRRFINSWFYVKVTKSNIADYNPLFAMQSCVAFTVDSKLLCEDYLLYALQTEMVKKQAEAYRSSIIGFISIEDLKAIRIPLPSLLEQQEIVDIQRKRFALKVEKDRKAEESRREFIRSSSDLIHMLGTPLSNMRTIIDVIEEEITEEGRSYFYALRDNFDYLSRLIKLGNTDFSSMERYSLNIKAFLSNYLKAYHNFGAKSFDITYQDILTGNEEIAANADALSVMMDCLLDNAHRHGFDKSYTEGNIVSIRAEVFEAENAKLLLLCIKNNGLPIPEGFTLDDYASRGKFAMKTGRTGLGGAHVAEIIKAIEGTLDFSVDNPDSKNLSTVGPREVWTRFSIQIPIL